MLMISGRVHRLGHHGGCRHSSLQVPCTPTLGQAPQEQEQWQGKNETERPSWTLTLIIV
jgi:hypothetical protein